VREGYIAVTSPAQRAGLGKTTLLARTRPRQAYRGRREEDPPLLDRPWPRMRRFPFIRFQNRRSRKSAPHFSAKPRNLGMRPPARNVIIVA
jgi:hypothetical protein